MRAVVTGAGSGLGRAFCLEVARRSGRCVVSDVDPERAEQTAELVRQAGAESVVQLCDVRDLEQVRALEAFARAHFGGVDLLCNNAGVAVSGPFEDVPTDAWRWIVDINLWGVIHGCRVFLPGMRAAGRGQVINVASAAGLLCSPDMSAYNTTKAAVVGLSESLYGEYHGTGVQIGVLCPTFFQTRIMDDGRGPGSPFAGTARRRMQTSRVQAPEVARRALDDVAAGRLYCVPMRDGRSLWRLKRLAPQAFHSAVGIFWRRRS